MEIYTERKTCILCNGTTLTPMWDKSFEIPLGCYVVPSKDTRCDSMPFNVLKCEGCRCYQTQYLGNVDIIYNYNANCHGTIRSTMNTLFAKFICEDTKVEKIIEIGGGNGGLSDIVLESLPEVSYTIIDPTYSGNETGKIVRRDFFENIEESSITADSIVMSHVFEHFYEPTKIMERFQRMDTIQHIFLNFPDLESYIKDDNYHVLNPEHIYYVDNDCIVQLFKRYGFSLEKIYYHEKHSVFFKFTKIKEMVNPISLERVNPTSEIDVPAFFQRIFDRVKHIEGILDHYPTRKVYIWPCSMHTIFLFALGLDPNRIEAILDNSPHKIGQYLYGSKKPCIPFQKVFDSSEDCIVLLNGGCYNTEISKGYPHIMFI